MFSSEVHVVSPDIIRLLTLRAKSASAWQVGALSFLGCGNALVLAGHGLIIYLNFIYNDNNIKFNSNHMSRVSVPSNSPFLL